jgi:hypothetical protein
MMHQISNMMNTLIIILIISSCSNKNNTEKPARVNSIPEKAFWVGGRDGGNWYLVDYIHPHRNNADIKVYNDDDGSLIISKRFILTCPTDNQVLIGNLTEQINAFDGKIIYLKSAAGKKGCFLQ